MQKCYLINSYSRTSLGAQHEEPARQCRRHGFDPRSWKIPHAAGQLSRAPQLLTPVPLQTVLHNRRSRSDESRTLPRGPGTAKSK